MSEIVKKAVIPAAGLGTRMLPASKAMPKEMVTIVDKPSIQYIIEEIVEEGISEVLLITASGKADIEDHFDRLFNLEDKLNKSGKKELLEEVIKISNLAKFFYTRQGEAKGLGHAIGCAEAFAKNDNFLVCLPDDLVAGKNVTGEMIETFNKYKSPVIAFEEVDPETVSSYGIAEGKDLGNGVIELTDIIEKPPKDKAPTNLAVVGRYIFTPDIFDAIKNTTPGRNNEIQITDAVKLLMQKRKIYGKIFTGKRFDTGNVLGYLKAVLYYGIRHPKYGKEILEIVKDSVNES